MARPTVYTHTGKIHFTKKKLDSLVEILFFFFLFYFFFLISEMKLKREKNEIYARQNSDDITSLNLIVVVLKTCYMGEAQDRHLLRSVGWSVGRGCCCCCLTLKPFSLKEKIIHSELEIGSENETKGKTRRTSKRTRMDATDKIERRKKEGGQP